MKAMDKGLSGIEMPFRPMGQTGLKLSVLGLGSWITFGGQIKDAKCIRQIYAAAYDAGIRFFDTASSYSAGEAERQMGLALQSYPRNTLIMSSKASLPLSDDPNNRGLSRKHIFETVEKSLTHLGTDYLDLFFCHRFDPETPLEETVRILDDLVRQGKILYWGTSQWRANQISRIWKLANRAGFYRPQAEQVELSLFERLKFDWDTGPIAHKHRLGLVTFSPLACGKLTGKYDEGIPAGSRLDQVSYCGRFTEEHHKKSQLLKKLAYEVGCTRAQLAIAWVLAQPGVSSVIIGASHIAQLEENLGALQVELTPDIHSRLNKIFTPGVKRILRFKVRNHLQSLRDTVM
jgi:voltage-dependent potassium channel beta subunit